MSTRPPLSLAHVGITVPDLDEATAWYAEVFDLQELDYRTEVKSTDSPELAKAIAELYDERCEGLRISFLIGANGASLELFEFEGPAYVPPDDPQPYYRGGVFHLGFAHPDIEGALDRVEAAGGSRRSDVLEAFPGQPYKFAFCADPYGNVIELQSHSMTQMFANQG